MKFLRNIFIIVIVSIALFSICIHLAEKSSGNTAYLLMIAGVITVLIARFLMNLNLLSSFKKDYDATPEELNQKSIKVEKYYVGEIFMFIAGSIFFIYGYNEFILNGLNKFSAVYFAGSIICFVTIIKLLIDKKSRVSKITKMSILEKNNFKKDYRIIIFVAIVLMILSYLYKFFN